MISTVVRITCERFKTIPNACAVARRTLTALQCDIQPNEAKEANVSHTSNRNKAQIQYCDTSEKDDVPCHTLQNAVKH